MNERHARELVARERARVEGLLAAQAGEIRADGSLQRQQSAYLAECARKRESSDGGKRIACPSGELSRKAECGPKHERGFGAGDGSRTRDIQLGRPKPPCGCGVPRGGPSVTCPVIVS